MFDRDKQRQMTSSLESSSDLPEQTAVRATLRLLFDSATADRLAGRAGSRLDRLIRSAIRQWTIERWFGRISRGTGTPGDQPPLSARANLPARGAVALAFQLGLGTTGEFLASATDASVSQIGTDLFRARQAMASRGAGSCGQFTSAIGRYRDPSLAINDRATLIHHAQHCDACRHAIERFQVVDAQLLDRIERMTDTLPDASETKSRSSRRRLLAAMVLVLAVTAAGMLVSSLQHGPTASPGTPVAAADNLTGWILRQDNNGAVTAINLATGLQESVGPPDAQTASLQYTPGTAILSPNRRLIVRQQPVGQPNPHDELTVFTVDSQVVQTVEFQEGLNCHLDGWLGNDTVLEVIEPQGNINQPFNDYVTGLQQGSTVVAVNVLTGKQREIFRGSVAAVFPSPDQSLVTLRTWDNANGGPAVFELRPLSDNAIGDPVARITLGDGSDPVWAPDSSHFYAALNPQSIRPTATPTDVTPTPGVLSISQLRTVSIDRNGNVSDVPALSGSEPNYPLAISPDGAALFRASIVPGTESDPAQCRLWRTDLANATSTALTGPTTCLPQRGTWSPDGTTFLIEVWHPFLIASSVDNSALGDVWSTSISAVFPDGQIERVRNQLGDQFYAGLVGWLPVGELRDHTSAESGSQPGETRTVDFSEPQLALDSSSSASPDGAYVVLHDGANNGPLIWNRSSRSARRLPPGTVDLSWLPQSDMLIGVGRIGTGQQQNLSRLMTFAPQFDRSVPYFDFRSYDPAGIGESTTKHYAAPSFSSDEGALTFFVVDSRSGTVDLWLAEYGSVPRSVHSWTVPPGSKLDIAPVAAWIDNRTLLFAEPGDWKDGLPRQTELQRLSLNDDGTKSVSTLTTLHTHGNERGVELRELAIGQRSSAIAYRLRHFTRSSTDSGYFDSVAIVTLAHPTAQSNSRDKAPGPGSTGLRTGRCSPPRSPARFASIRRLESCSEASMGRPTQSLLSGSVHRRSGSPRSETGQTGWWRSVCGEGSLRCTSSEDRWRLWNRSVEEEGMPRPHGEKRPTRSQDHNLPCRRCYCCPW